MIKFLDLKKINQLYEAAFQEKLKNVLDNGWYILGNEVKDFEKNFANYCNSNYCIGVGNGLDALVLIFKAYIQLGKLAKGDEVIVPANTYIASILAILQADLVPVLVEPNDQSFNIDFDLIQEKISPKTKAILVVHLYGQLADMNSINLLANQNKLLVIEDAAVRALKHPSSPLALPCHDAFFCGAGEAELMTELLLQAAKGQGYQISLKHDRFGDAG